VAEFWNLTASAGCAPPRHRLASALLRAGNSLPQIGQVLRHRSQLSTSPIIHPPRRDRLGGLMHEYVHVA
jgi:hypothetical protein